MVKYSKNPISTIEINGTQISVFEIGNENIDKITVESFGEEWSKFAEFTEFEIKNAGNQYFDIITPEMLNKNSLVLDMGCGTGRWSKFVAQKAKFVEAIDPSKAVISAASLLRNEKNIRISQASVAEIPFEDQSFDFVFSLGVLHHIPNTPLAMQQTVKKLKIGGYFLVYLYYNFEQRGLIFKCIFGISNFIRKIISSLPTKIKKIVCDILALTIYLPFTLLAKLFYALNFEKIANKIPLSYYYDKSFNIIRNDALDRFGTPLEQRFTKNDIIRMMKNCGLDEINISENTPFWHAVGKKI